VLEAAKAYSQTAGVPREQLVEPLAGSIGSLERGDPEVIRVKLRGTQPTVPFTVVFELMEQLDPPAVGKVTEYVQL
jgi:hypothetical protein